MSVLGWLPRKLGRIVADQVHDRLAPVLRDADGRFAALALKSGPKPAMAKCGTTISFDYPTSAANRPRWTAEAGSHPGVRRLIERDEPVWTETVRRISERGEELVRRHGGSGIPETADEADPRPRWRNAMMAGLDGVAFAAFLGPEARQVLEIGSGNSTKFLRHLIGALELKTRIVSVDPFPRAECDALCDTVIREPLETVDLALFDGLRPGDVVFFDGSHRCFMNSDVTAFFLDVLARVPTGVAIGIHDIFLPDDYPEEWAERYYSEQYVLAAWLLGAEGRYRVTLPAYWVSRNRERLGLDAIADAYGCPRDRFDGCAFWIEKIG